MDPSGTDDASSGGDRPLTIKSYRYALEPLGHTINFIHNLLQFFIENYSGRTGLYKHKMQELFK